MRVINNILELHLNYLEFMGRILGKALYEGILVGAEFASFFIEKWLGNKNYRKSFSIKESFNSFSG